jgi:hypothetical protein
MLFWKGRLGNRHCTMLTVPPSAKSTGNAQTRKKSWRQLFPFLF